MNKFLLFISIFIVSKVQAQVPEDAVRYSWYAPGGSARNMAIGGAMGSLGGEITAPFVNPAGLAFYRNSEFVFTPGYFMNNNVTDYRESRSNSSKNVIGWGPTGLIIGKPNKFDKNKNTAICIGFNQRASFNNILNYSGLNNYSSFSEQFVEEFVKSGLSIDAALSSSSNVPYTVAPALYTYLIDTVRVNGVLQVKAAPENLLDSGIALEQKINKVTRGGLYEFGFSLAHQFNEHWLAGGTLGLSILSYKSDMTFSETDQSGDTSNGFRSFSYNDNFSTYGTGMNLKLGVIYRPKEYIRFGFAFHTPDLMMLTDKRNTSLTNTLESPVQTFSISSSTFTNNQTGQVNYALNTAWKAMISGSYVFREEENVRRQKGFITADIEYVRHTSSRFGVDNSTDVPPTTDQKNYYKALNNVVKENYKGTFNFKVGGELKFDVIMGRLGFAYYGNPYVDEAFKAHRMIVSGGLGYRNRGFFIDITYAYQIRKDVDLPYRLADRANTFADFKQKTGNIIATFGVKL